MGFDSLQLEVESMTRTRIKICGVRDVATALAAADAGADVVGLVFAASSPRYVDEQAAAQIVSALPTNVEPAGLFVDASAEDIRRSCDATGIRTVQLHGREPLSVLDALSDLRVIRALPFDADRLDDALRWDGDPRVWALLFDAAQGGSGEAFDWHALAAVSPGFGKPIILAGGLTPDNVAEAIAVVGPAMVDVSSGVESSRGVKDPAMIRAFCEAVRGV